MFHKKVYSLALATLFLGTASVSTSVSAQVNFAQCANVTVTEISSGPQSGTLVRLSSTACGRGGFVCLAESGTDVTADQSRQAYAAALTAQATAASLVVRWNTDVDGCEGRATGGFPVIYDLRVQSAI